MLAAILLYVGAVLFMNGLWLWGQASDSVVLKIENREIIAINVLTGVLGFVLATSTILRGGMADPVDMGWIATGGFELLFAFTYLWLAFNQATGVNGRGLGWFSLFVAITAVPTGFIVLANAAGDPWQIWLGLNWLAWALLWFLFFLVLTPQVKITRVTGIICTAEGILTGWIPAYLIFQGYLVM